VGLTLNTSTGSEAMQTSTRVQPSGSATNGAGKKTRNESANSSSGSGRRASATARAILDRIMNSNASSEAFSKDAPAGWHRAAIVIQKHFRGYRVRALNLQRGGTMFKSHFEYMTNRQLTWLETVALVCVAFFHQLAFVIIFTEPGYGDEAFRALAPLSALAFTVGWAGVAISVVLYLLDAHLWPGPAHLATVALSSAAAVLILAGLVMAAGTYPQAPLCVYLFLVPTAFYALRIQLLDDTRMSSFLKAVGYPSAVGGTAMVAGWLIWVGVTDSPWDGALRARYYALMLCDPAAPACLPAAILYFAPLGAGMVNLLFGGVCYMLALSVTPKRYKTLHVMVRMFALCAMLIVAAMYVQAAVSGANSSLANTVLLFAIAGLVLMAVLVAKAVGWEMLSKRFLNIPLIKKVQQSFMSDWAKAAMFFGGWLPFGIWIALALVKQRVRVFLWLKGGEAQVAPPRAPLTVRRRDWLTQGAGQIWSVVSAWRWNSVLSKAIWIGVFFMVMNFGFGTMTNVFISWLIDALLAAGLGVGPVIGIFAVVGILLFMIPPVPGFAVYLMGSFLIPQFVGFWVGVVVSAAVSFGLKVSALVIQQKIIGEQLGSLVSVRALIGVNSITMRAIRKILEQPGMGLAKMCILVGGPDWPTSVTTGILRLNVFSMILGTSPVVVVVFAVTLAGAFQLRKAEGGVWESLSSLTLAVASGVMFASLVASAYFIEDTAEKHREELEQLPRDEEVDAQDAVKEEKSRVFNEVTAWKPAEDTAYTMPLWMRANLVLGAGLQVVTCYVAQFFASRCFVPFQMTDSIEEDLDGDWTRVVRPLGRFILLLWCVSVLNLLLFRFWAGTRVKAYHAAREGGGGMDLQTAGGGKSSA